MKLIALVFLMSANILLHAQQFNVTLTSDKQGSDPLVLKFGENFFSLNTEILGISGFSGNLKRTIHSIEINKYDTDMKLVKSVKLSNGERLFGPMAPLLKIISNKLYLLYYKMPDEGKVHFFSAEINPVSLELAEPTELLDIKQKVRFIESHIRSIRDYHPNRYVEKNLQASEVREYPNLLHKTFFFEPSPDGTKFFLLWNSGWDNRLFFSVLDKDLKKIRTGEEEVPDEISLSLNTACIDNSANIYIAYFYEKKNKTHAELLVNTKAGKSLVKEIIIPDAEPYGVFTAITKENKIYINGAYKENSWNLSGVFIQSLNPADLQLSAVTKTVFPKDLVEILDKEGWASTKGKKYGLSYNLVLESHTLENGSIDLIGEFRSTRSGIKAIFNMSGSIFNARFNENGAVFSRIPKMRVSAGSTFGDSYRVFEYKNKLIVFYNDHASNVNLDISKAPTRSDNYSNSVLVAATISEDGTVKREIIIDQSKENFLSSNLTMQQISAASYVVALRRIKNLGGVTNDFKWAILEIK